MRNCRITMFGWLGVGCDSANWYLFHKRDIREWRSLKIVRRQLTHLTDVLPINDKLQNINAWLIGGWKLTDQIDTYSIRNKILENGDPWKIIRRQLIHLTDVLPINNKPQNNNSWLIGEWQLTDPIHIYSINEKSENVIRRFSDVNLLI